MKVSILITSFNYGRFLRRAIDSCLSQNYPDLEVWVIDGGSTDDTVEVLRSYGDRVNWLSERDRGESHAMNKGLALITGDVVNFLCADNYLTEGAVRTAVDALKQYPQASMAFSDMIIRDKYDQFRYVQKQAHLSFDAILNYAPSVAQPAAFIRTDLVRRLGGVREDLRYGNDHELWLRILREAPGIYVNSALAVYIEHEQTITTRHRLRALWQTYRINRQYGGRLLSRSNYHLLRFAIFHFIR